MAWIKHVLFHSAEISVKYCDLSTIFKNGHHWQSMRADWPSLWSTDNEIGRNSLLYSRSAPHQLCKAFYSETDLIQRDRNGKESWLLLVNVLNSHFLLNANYEPFQLKLVYIQYMHCMHVYTYSNLPLSHCFYSS